MEAMHVRLDPPVSAGPTRARRGARGLPKRAAVGASLAAVALLAAACSGSGSVTRTTHPSHSHSGVALADENAKQLAAGALASIGDRPAAQLEFSLTGSKFGSATALVEGLHLLVDTSSTDGTTALSAAGSAVASEVRLESGSSTLLDLIETGPTSVFARVGLKAVLGLPVPFSAAQRSQIASIEPFLDGRWFELPASALKKAESGRSGAATLPSGLSSSEVTAFSRALGQALLGSLTFTKEGQGAGGAETVQVTGTLKDLVDAALPAVGQFLRAAGTSLTLPSASIDQGLSATPVDLTGTLDLDGSGTLTSLQLAASAGAVTAAVTVKVSHDATKVTAPSGAVALPQSLVSQLGGLGLGSAGTGAPNISAKSLLPLITAGSSGSSGSSVTPSA